MQLRFKQLAVCTFLGLIIAVPSQAFAETDTEIRKRLIQASVLQSGLKCACPWQVKSNGARCGKSSAYSRPGGQSPLCYEQDITDEMIRQYRSKVNGGS